jgi:hypothetical protein
MREGKVHGEVSIAPWLHFWVRHFDRRSQILLITHTLGAQSSDTISPVMSFFPLSRTNTPTLTSLLAPVSRRRRYYTEQVARGCARWEWVSLWPVYFRQGVCVRHFTSPASLQNLWTERAGAGAELEYASLKINWPLLLITCNPGIYAQPSLFSAF